MDNWSRSISTVFHRQAQDWAAFAYEANGAECLMDLVPIRFSVELGSGVGACHLTPIRTLELSSVHWPYIDEDLRRHAVLHLACHHVAYWQAESGQATRYSPHGDAWNSAMVDAGEPSFWWDREHEPPPILNRLCTLDATRYSSVQLLRLG